MPRVQLRRPLIDGRHVVRHSRSTSDWLQWLRGRLPEDGLPDAGDATAGKDGELVLHEEDEVGNRGQGTGVPDRGAFGSRGERFGWGAREDRRDEVERAVFELNGLL